MQLRYDEDFLEATVFLCAGGRRKSVPPPQILRFHREREKLYLILDPDERNAAFFRLNLEWFREWGLEKLLTDLLAEFPLLSNALNVLAFRKARGKSDEGAELYVNREATAHRHSALPALGHPLPSSDEGRGQGEGCESQRNGGSFEPDQITRHGVIALRPERFERDAELSSFLRHELTHLHDMVNPAFAYSRDLTLPGQSTSQQRLIRERYRLLWDITIDGRLLNSNRATIAAREERTREFDRAFSFLSETRRMETFDELWMSSSPSHRKLVQLAADPRDLHSAHEPQPGAVCPLCGFPTFRWSDKDALDPNIVQSITVEFPMWTAEQGVCQRCVDVYKAARQLTARP